MTKTKRIDPASVRYTTPRGTYRIGTRVRTPAGLGTVTGFDPGEPYPIGIALDDDPTECWTTFHYAEIVEAKQ